jgi:hypothetical protein
MADFDAIVGAVTADPTLAGYIGDRLWPLVLPSEPVLPAMTYALVSQPTEFTQDSAQYRMPRWRLRVYSRRYADLEPVARGIAGIFGDQSRTPFPSSRIEYPASAVEEIEPDTHFYTRAVDVVVGSAPAGEVAQ